MGCLLSWILEYRHLLELSAASLYPSKCNLYYPDPTHNPEECHLHPTAPEPSKWTGRWALSPSGPEVGSILYVFNLANVDLGPELTWTLGPSGPRA